jgi:hypothetical protein
MIIDITYLPCLGHIGGNPAWPAVLTATNRIYLSSAIAADSGLVTSPDFKYIYIADEPCAIKRLAVLSDDLCAFDITAPVWPTLPALPLGEWQLYQPMPPAISQLHHAHTEHGPLTLIGHARNRSYFQPSTTAIPRGTPAFYREAGNPATIQLIGFIDHIERDYIAATRFSPKT